MELHPQAACRLPRAKAFAFLDGLRLTNGNRFLRSDVNRGEEEQGKTEQFQFHRKQSEPLSSGISRRMHIESNLRETASGGSLARVARKSASTLSPSPVFRSVSKSMC